MLVENANIKQNMTAGDVRKEYPMFNEYSYNCFSSALNNCRKNCGKEVDARVPQTGTGGGNSNSKSYTLDDEDEDEDEDYEVDVSKMSMDDDDDFTFDTFSIGCGGGKSIGKSVTFGATSFHSANSNKKNIKKTSLPTTNMKKTNGGTTKPLSCTMPYIVDYWHDGNSRARASVQVHIPSFNKKEQQLISYRVASNQKEFVVTVPMSGFLIDKDAINIHISAALHEKGINHDAILDYHSKTNARKLFLSKLEKKIGGNRTMECRIPLRLKVCLDYASEAHGDPYFYGHKIIHYDDGSSQLHVELIADVSTLGNTIDAAREFTIPGSVNVTSECDDTSYMEYTVHSKKSGVSGYSGGASAASSVGMKSAKSRKTVAGTNNGTTSFSGTKRKIRSTQSVGN